MLRFYRDFTAEAPDELGNVVRLGTVPPLPVHPRRAAFPARHRRGVLLRGGRRTRRAAVESSGGSGRRSWTSSGPRRTSPTSPGSTTPTPHGWHYYWKATNLAGLTDDVIAVIADNAYAASSPRTYAAMFHMGGAVARVPHDATAYGGRDMPHNIIIDAAWLPEESSELAETETTWARQFLQALQPHRDPSVYVNFLDADDDASRLREAYSGATYRRLAEVKAKYDPDNAFHHNQNIRPG